MQNEDRKENFIYWIKESLRKNQSFKTGCISNINLRNAAKVKRQSDEKLPGRSVRVDDRTYCREES